MNESRPGCPREAGGRAHVVAASRLPSFAGCSGAVEAETGNEPAPGNHALRFQSARRSEDKARSSGWVDLAAECGAFATFMDSMRAMNLQDEDFRRLETALSGNPELQSASPCLKG